MNECTLLFQQQTFLRIDRTVFLTRTRLRAVVNTLLNQLCNKCDQLQSVDNFQRKRGRNI